MAQVIWTEPALTDLDEIAEYIALDNMSAAKRLVQQLFIAVDHLKLFPESGRIPPELEASSRYREIIIGPCRVFYRIEQNNLYILYVMRSERVLRKYLIDARIDSID
ncbi:MAG: type II toxin-antitoxin system RelE/ParE family toxin [Thermodesulfobacteriota bacterium]|nr:type II toxin-antitoxin system RelE/ParE family toxin [Thermodesulfobacteriota bacterium]